MSYHVTADGVLNFKEEVSIDRIKKLFAELEEHGPHLLPFYEEDITDRNVNVFMDGSYDDDDMRAFLKKSLPELSDGNISFKGEDDSYWEYYISVDGKWHESVGVIIYKDNGAI